MIVKKLFAGVYTVERRPSDVRPRPQQSERVRVLTRRLATRSEEHERQPDEPAALVVPTPPVLDAY